MPSTSSPSPGDGHSNIIHFAPGDYIYNFEHPLPASIPESCNATFGSTSYYLEVNITRPGAFKTNLAGRLPINIIRTLAETSLEENESIVITRDWEDQLRYDIVIGSQICCVGSVFTFGVQVCATLGESSFTQNQSILDRKLGILLF